ncbi:MAG: hypothetical protein KDK99_14480 [Verrucomicrobiales bacterium]|nr:hypothetical protein [Verrucomicrobiales bacterium]
MNFRRFISLCAALLLHIPSARSEVRTWTDDQGRAVTAEMVRQDGENIVLLVNGSEIPFPISKLSAEDQAWLQQKQETSAKAAFSLPGGVALKPGGRVEFFLDTTEDDRKEAKNPKMEKVRVVLAVPADFTPDRPWPIVVASTTVGGRNARAAGPFVEPGVAAGFIVLGAESAEEGAKIESDTWAYRGHAATMALGALHDRWPGSASWPRYFGGHSGGAKNSCHMACHLVGTLGVKVAGFFFSGCNQAMMDPAREEYGTPKTPFKDAAFFISNGVNDKIAPPTEGEKIADELKSGGYGPIRVETFDGAHEIHRPHIEAALAWFKEIASNQP